VNVFGPEGAMTGS